MWLEDEGEDEKMDAWTLSRGSNRINASVGVGSLMVVSDDGLAGCRVVDVAVCVRVQEESGMCTSNRLGEQELQMVRGRKERKKGERNDVFNAS